MLVILGLTAAPALRALAAREGKPGARPKRKPKEEDRQPDRFRAVAAEAVVSFTDDMEKLKSDLSLTDKQDSKLQDMRKARDAALAKLDEANQKRIERAHARVAKIRRASERMRAQKALEQYILGLHRARQRLADSHEKRMFAVLTVEQRVKWNTPVLQAEVEKEFQSLNLTDDQKTQIQTLCGAQAKQITAPVSPKVHASIIKLLTNQVNLRVLTPEQKKAYAQEKKSRLAPRPGDRGRGG